MVVNKLSAIILAEAFLLVVAGFAVSLYILPTATGTINANILSPLPFICLPCLTYFFRILPAVVSVTSLAMAEIKFRQLGRSRWWASGRKTVQPLVLGK